MDQLSTLLKQKDELDEQIAILSTHDQSYYDEKTKNMHYFETIRFYESICGTCEVYMMPYLRVLNREYKHFNPSNEIIIQHIRDDYNKLLENYNQRMAKWNAYDNFDKYYYEVGHLGEIKTDHYLRSHNNKVPFNSDPNHKYNYGTCFSYNYKIFRYNIENTDIKLNRIYTKETWEKIPKDIRNTINYINTIRNKQLAEAEVVYKAQKEKFPNDYKITVEKYMILYEMESYADLCMEFTKKLEVDVALWQFNSSTVEF